MLESGEGAGAVGVELAVSTVVKAEDVAGAAACGVCARALCQVLLNMLRDRLHAENQPVHRFFAPIAGNQRPHCGLVAEFASCGNDPGIAHAKGRAKPLWGRANGVEDCVVAKAQFNADLGWVEPQKIWVQLGVIPNNMSASNGFHHELRTFADVLPNQKKCGFGFAPLQEIK